MTLLRLFLILLTSSPIALGLAQGITDPGNKLDAYRKQNLQEKVFIHTDRTTYITGDYIWLRAYVVDGSLHRPLGMSRVV
jgi:hypothetical protein